MLFIPQFFVRHATVGYVLVAMCLMQTAQSFFGLNLQAWGAELTEDYHERTRVVGWRTIAASLASPIALAIGATVEQTARNPTNGQKLFYIALPVLVLMPVLNLLALTQVPERPPRVRAKAKHEQMSLRKSWMLLITNKNMLRLLVIDVFSAMPFSIFSAVNFFYVKYVLQAPRMQSLILLAGLTASFLSTPVWLAVARRFEKHKVIAFAAVLSAALTSVLIVFGRGDVIPYAIASSVLGFAAGAPLFLLQSIVADVVDSDTLATGEERTGTFYALTQLTMKFAPALGVMAAFPFLQWVGFDFTGKHNTPQSIAWLKYVYVLFPPIPLLITAWLAYTFPLGKKQQEELRDQIREQHGVK
jgi:glycoside/pentoside/hexuronide:cation symporter, GPH family